MAGLTVTKQRLEICQKLETFLHIYYQLLKLGVSMERKTYERSREKKVISFAGNDGNSDLI